MFASLYMSLTAIQTGMGFVIMFSALSEAPIYMGFLMHRCDWGGSRLTDDNSSTEPENIL